MAKYFLLFYSIQIIKLICKLWQTFIYYFVLFFSDKKNVQYEVKKIYIKIYFDQICNHFNTV